MLKEWLDLPLRIAGFFLNFATLFMMADIWRQLRKK